MATLAANSLQFLMKMSGGTERVWNSTKTAYRDAFLGTSQLIKGIGGKLKPNILNKKAGTSMQIGYREFKKHLASTPAKIAFASGVTATIGGIGAAAWGFAQLFDGSLDESMDMIQNKMPTEWNA